MYVDSHSLQEMIEYLLWCSWYHSVPSEDEKNFNLKKKQNQIVC